MNVRVSSQVAERLKTQFLRKLVFFKKIPEMLGLDCEYPDVNIKAKFCHFIPLSLDHLILHFLKILVLEMPICSSNLFLRQLSCKKMHEYKIFLKTIFCTIASGMHLGLSTVPVAA